ncbi:MAG: aldo/keto reductase, partial [Alphaproteobacteria bacterium]|nr:aldo/keto reductase [Alphaproteobacteria bacterium]
QVVLRWILDRSGVAGAIIGATSTRHLAENLGVFGIALTSADRAEIAAALDRGPGLEGDCYDLERDKTGRHGRIMRYNQNQGRV